VIGEIHAQLADESPVGMHATAMNQHHGRGRARRGAAEWPRMDAEKRALAGAQVDRFADDEARHDFAAQPCLAFEVRRCRTGARADDDKEREQEQPYAHPA
jgi:hypothetical protein